MKTKIALSIFLSSYVTALAATEQLRVLSPNGGTHLAGSKLQISWTHPSIYAGETVFVTIKCAPLSTEGTMRTIQSQPILTSEKITVMSGTPPPEIRSWPIPEDFPPGAYILEIVEVGAGNLGTLTWDKSDGAFVITPTPVIKFTSHNQGEEVRVGSSPQFDFSLQGAGTWGIEAYLTKDESVIGVLWWNKVENKGDGETFTWDLTWYQTPISFHFPRAGGGYRILIGVLKDPDESAYVSATKSVDLDAFASTDETAPFSIVGGVPFLVSDRHSDNSQDILYVVGEPGSRFELYWSSSIFPGFWFKAWEATIGASGVEKLFLDKDVLDTLFFQAILVSANR